MTNKEAIKILKDMMSDIFQDMMSDEQEEALELAIKALEENELLKSDIDGLNNQMDDLCENLAFYINERNRLLNEIETKIKGKKRL